MRWHGTAVWSRGQEVSGLSLNFSFAFEYPTNNVLLTKKIFLEIFYLWGGDYKGFGQIISKWMKNSNLVQNVFGAKSEIPQEDMNFTQTVHKKAKTLPPVC